MQGAPKLADIGLVTDADTTLSYVGTEGLFDLYVLKERLVGAGCREGTRSQRRSSVYLAKHRVGALVKKELKRLQQKME